MDANDTEALNGIMTDEYDESEWLSADCNLNNGQVNELNTLVPIQQTECESVQNEHVVPNANSSGNDNDLNRPQMPAKGVKMVKMNNGQIQVTQTLYDDDGEIEMTYIQGQELRPKKRDKYQMKVNDALSGNLPFQENVCNCFFL